MQLPKSLFLFLFPPFLSLPSTLAVNPPSSSSSSSSSPSIATTLTLRVPPSPPLLPNPHALPASTRATLTTLGKPVLAAPLSVANTFVFRNVTPGSYLLDVHCATHAFAPLRVDVFRDVDGGGGGGGEGAGQPPVLRAAAWETFRGNDWGNKGEAVTPVTVPLGGEDGEGEGVQEVLDVRVAGVKGYFMERSKCMFADCLASGVVVGPDRLCVCADDELVQSLS